jgi:hypothetical protein
MPHYPGKACIEQVEGVLENVSYISKEDILLQLENIIDLP